MNQQAEIMLTPCSIKKNGYEPKILSLEQRLAADVMIGPFQSGNLKIMSQLLSITHIPIKYYMIKVSINSH